MRSIAVRRPALRSLTCVAESVALIASFIATMVAPRMMVVMRHRDQQFDEGEARGQLCVAVEALSLRVAVVIGSPQEIDETYVVSS